MFYYVKMIGDEPICIESKEQIKKEDFSVKPENVYFLMVMQTHQGPAMIPIPAEDQGLKDSDIMIYGDSISMIAKLGEKSPIVEGIKETKTKRSGIITPEKSKLIL